MVDLKCECGGSLQQFDKAVIGILICDKCEKMYNVFDLKQLAESALRLQVKELHLNFFQSCAWLQKEIDHLDVGIGVGMPMPPEYFCKHKNKKENEYCDEATCPLINGQAQN